MLTCNVKRKHLLPALELLKACLAIRSGTHAVQDVLFEGHEKGIILSANNNVTALKTFVPAEMQDLGTFVLPAEKSYEIVKVSGENLSIASTENQVTITSSSTVSKLNLRSVSDIPVFPVTEKLDFIELDADALSLCIANTIGSVCATDENKFALTSLALTMGKDKVDITGCNGYKLTVSSLNLSGLNATRDKPILVASHGAKLVQKFLKNHKKASIAFGEKKMVLRNDSSLLVNHLTKGEYPDTASVFQSFTPKNKVITPQKELVSAIRRTMIFSDDLFSSITFKLSNNTISLVSDQQDVGAASEKIQVEFDGPEMKLPLNPKYILDTLHLMSSSDNVEIQTEAEDRPVVIRAVGKPDFYSLIMPVQR